MKPAKTKYRTSAYGIDVGTCHCIEGQLVCFFGSISFPTIFEGVEHLHQLPQKGIFLGGSTAKKFAAEAPGYPKHHHKDW